MAIVNTSISPLIKNGSNITVSGSGQVTTIAADFSTAINLTSGQIQFPATQVPSSNANTLDDYEENTWTPSLVATSAVFSYATNGRIASYTKIGRMVTIQFRIQLATSGNTLNANTLTITGLPFSAGNETNRSFYGSVYWDNCATSMINIIAEIKPNESSINLYRLTAAAGSIANMVSNNLSGTAGSVLGGTITYFV